MENESGFKHWKLADFNLEYDVLELRFWFFPQIKSDEDLEKYNAAHAKDSNKGKGIFLKVSYLDLFNYRAFATVSSVVASTVEGSNLLKYRFNLEQDGYVDVEAQNYVEVLW